ncbi:hypothetical protein E4U54_001196, partial [Claviceps lovelessii]
MGQKGSNSEPTFCFPTSTTTDPDERSRGHQHARRQALDTRHQDTRKPGHQDTRRHHQPADSRQRLVHSSIPSISISISVSISISISMLHLHPPAIVTHAIDAFKAIETFQTSFQAFQALQALQMMQTLLPTTMVNGPRRVTAYACTGP